MKKIRILFILGCSVNLFFLENWIASRAYAETPEVVYKIVSMQEDGFEVSVTIDNTQQSMSNWQLEFDLPQRIESVWNAALVSRLGNHYVIKNFETVQQPGEDQSLNFWFIGRLDPDKTAIPSSCLINSETCHFSIQEIQGGVRYGRL